MNSEELKNQLVRETLAKNQSVESAKLALSSAVETLKKDFSESASNLRDATRTEVQKTRESMEAAVLKTRESFEKIASEEREKLATFHRKIWAMSVALIPFVIILTAAGTLGLIWFGVSRGTSQALGNLQHSAVKDLAETRAQTEQLKAQGRSLSAQIAQEKQMRDQITLLRGTRGEIFVVIPPGVKPFNYESQTLIEILKK